ncbi:hypothetical protein KAH81_02345 [bacterium]|nr:hypothetical protein [bacterium]
MGCPWGEVYWISPQKHSRVVIRTGSAAEETTLKANKNRIIVLSFNLFRAMNICRIHRVWIYRYFG